MSTIDSVSSQKASDTFDHQLPSDEVNVTDEPEELWLDENMGENERLAYRLAGWVVQRGLMIREIRAITVQLWCEKNAPEVTKEQQTEMLNIFPDYLIPLDSPQSRFAGNNATLKSGIIVPWRSIQLT